MTDGQDIQSGISPDDRVEISPEAIVAVDQNRPMLEALAAEWLGIRDRKQCEPHVLVEEACREFLNRGDLESDESSSREEIAAHLRRELTKSYQRFLLNKLFREEVDPLRLIAAVAENAAFDRQKLTSYWNWIFDRVSDEVLSECVSAMRIDFDSTMSPAYLIVSFSDLARGSFAARINAGEVTAASYDELRQGFRKIVWREFLKASSKDGHRRVDEKIFNDYSVAEEFRSELLDQAQQETLADIDNGRLDLRRDSAKFTGIPELNRFFQQCCWREIQRRYLQSAIDAVDLASGFIRHLEQHDSFAQNELSDQEIKTLVARAKNAIRVAIKKDRRNVVDAKSADEMRTTLYQLMRRQLDQRDWLEELQRQQNAFISRLAARLWYRDVPSGAVAASDILASAEGTVLKRIELGLCDAETIEQFGAFFRRAMYCKFIDKVVPTWKRRSQSISSDSEDDASGLVWQLVANEQDDAESKDLAEKVADIFERVLTDEEQNSIRLCLGYQPDGDAGWERTQEEAGWEQDLSRDQVKRRIASAMKKFKAECENSGLIDTDGEEPDLLDEEFSDPEQRD